MCQNFWNGVSISQAVAIHHYDLLAKLASYIARYIVSSAHGRRQTISSWLAVTGICRFYSPALIDSVPMLQASPPKAII